MKPLHGATKKYLVDPTTRARLPCVHGRGKMADATGDRRAVRTLRWGGPSFESWGPPPSGMVGKGN